MSHAIKPIERLFLWRLAVTDGGWLSDKGLKPALEAAARKRLESAGLIETTKQRNPETGRDASFITLTDKGWATLGASLDGDLTTRTPAGTEVLRLLLLRLKTFLDHRDLSLGDLFAPGETEPTADGPTADARANGDIAGRVASAYLALSGGEANVRVRLADLRRAVATVPRTELDRALFDLEANGEASLYRLDNPNEIGPEDREAALRTPLGEERHIIYLGGRRS